MIVILLLIMKNPFLIILENNQALDPVINTKLPMCSLSWSTKLKVTKQTAQISRSIKIILFGK